jgi:hypothetical protein
VAPRFDHGHRHGAHRERGNADDEHDESRAHAHEATARRQDLATGACTGTPDYQGYTLTGCKVSGNSYVFTVNLGANYHSYNAGTINGNSVMGSFTDTNGTKQNYTATRTPLCIVPNLRGLSTAAAKRALSQANCTAGRVTSHKSSTVPKGHVISSSPSAATQHKAGTKVALSVSRGKH